MNSFDFDTDTDKEPAMTRTQPPQWGTLWFVIFSSALAAVLLGGLILGLGVRAYVHHSIKDTLENKRVNK